ncbi:MAG: tetratricopeptide repeat protein [Planctomycetaceae bacterium]|jgi:tetratricopeptide (TPR) repeat protein|nr:tetratricopeptide repeat protein [Planctomycetaceae bacterium]
MAKRPAEDDEEEVQVIRKRRRPKKKPEDDEEGGAPGQQGKGGPADEDEDDEEGGSISTGIVILDIVLDFRDDCIDWGKANFFYAMLICIVSFIIFAVVTSLTIHSWVRYLMRPSLESVLKTYDIGAYGDANLYADEALIYTGINDVVTRAGLAFVQGAANVAVGDSMPEIDKLPYYLTAVNYLKESAQYGFVDGRVNEGFFLLGKALYLCGELTECRKPLEAALEKTTPHRKMILWYLANAYCFGAHFDGQNNLKTAQGYLQHFQSEPTVTEEQLAESSLLTAIIELQKNELDAAGKAFAKVPHFDRFSIMRHYVEGLIEFQYGRKLRKQAEEIENNPNPVVPEQLPTAPAPVKKMENGEWKTEKDKENGNGYAAAPYLRYQLPEQAPIAVLPVQKMREKIPEERNEMLIPSAAAITDTYAKRLAELQPKYGQDAGKVIVLPKAAPTPAPMPQEMKKELPQEEPQNAASVEERIKAFYNAAAERYKNAIQHFTEIVQQDSFTSRFLRNAELLAGICSDELNICQTKTGNKVSRKGSEYFMNLTASYPNSPETAAASFLLGEQDRKIGETEMSYREFARTFSILRKTPGYYNAWVPKELMTNTMLEYIRKSVENRNYSDAVTLLKLVKGVIPDIDEARLRGETYEGWGTTLKSQSETVFGDSGNQLVKEAEGQFRLAGKAFDDYAVIIAGSPLFDDVLWRSAENYRLGNDFRSAVIEYRKYAKANYLEHRPELYLYLGELYLNLDILTESASVLERALKDYPADNLTPSIRLVLSRTYQELAPKEADMISSTDADSVRDYLSEAKTLLLQNLAGEFAPASSIYRDSLYALGQLCYRRNELPEAAAHLEDAVKIHPDAVQAADGYYTLALCYQRQAENALAKLDDSSTEKMHNAINAAATENRQMALTNLKRGIGVLSEREKGIGLTGSEQLMLRNAQFAVGTLMMKMNLFREAVPVWNQTAMYYQNKPEALDALISLAYALRKTGRKEESLSMLNRANVLLNQLVQNDLITDSERWRNLIEQEKRKE